MTITKKRPLCLPLVPLLCGLGTSACTNNDTVPSGTCVVDPATVNCTIGGASPESLGLVAYSCTGTARPDYRPTYIDGVPQGLVCADQGPASGDGPHGYCCSSQTTSCAYDPVAICDPDTTGYQCWGADRPEALNPAVYCNQGVRKDDLIKYCCSGTKRTPGCTQSDAVGCSARLMGWICPAGSLPTAQDLGANKSRADLYYQLCSVPKPAANPSYNTFCCYTPGLGPPGGSCVQHTGVSDCQPGRFGFACYGPDTPEEDYNPRMHCPDPGFPGLSAERYPATLYCCDFQ
jgi:hypothetical protein